jgi:hypothetical protein
MELRFAGGGKMTGMTKTVAITDTTPTNHGANPGFDSLGRGPVAAHPAAAMAICHDDDQ